MLDMSSVLCLSKHIKRCFMMGSFHVLLSDIHLTPYRLYISFQNYILLQKFYFWND